jgi:hypothetical protein
MVSIRILTDRQNPNKEAAAFTSNFLCLRFLVLQLIAIYAVVFNSYPFGNQLLTVLHQASLSFRQGIAKNSSPPCALNSWLASIAISSNVSKQSETKLGYR